jgi:aldose 1-epimerase
MRRVGEPSDDEVVTPGDRAAAPGDGPETAGERGAPLDLRAGDAVATVLPEAGGRLGSLRVGGTELLVTTSPDGPIYWGAYPMAPWAGRIRHGRFTVSGREHTLPLGMPPHAIHGVVFDRPWRVAEQARATARITIELDDRWPFRGHVEQRFTLRPDGIDVAMALTALDAMPAAIGWHPWFRRVIGDSGMPPARLRLDAAEMLARDGEGIPTGERIEPPAGPWDDAFTGLRSNPVIEWPGQLRLELASTCDWWVVYTVPEHALCVEPESGPPDAANQAPEVLETGDVLEHAMRWRWTVLGPAEPGSGPSGRTGPQDPPSRSGGTR